MIGRISKGRWRTALVLATGTVLLLLGMPGSRGEVAQATVGAVTEYAIPTTGSGPRGITPGLDGNLYFTEYGASRIGRVTPAGAFTEFALPGDDRHPLAITTWEGKSLLFTEDAPSSRIGSVTLDGAVEETSVPSGGTLGGITPSPLSQGSYWFTEVSANKIGRFLFGFSEFPLPTPNSQPTGIVTGPDGNIWFTEMAGNKIGRMAPSGQSLVEFPIPTPNSGPNQITTGPDGKLYFTETDGNRIGRITPKGTITEFPLPTPESSPVGIITGPDRNIWFTERSGGRIGRLTTAGAITEFQLPDPDGAPVQITAGPDGAVWFTDDRGGSGQPEQIGRVEVTSPGILSLPGGFAPSTFTALQGTNVRWNFYAPFKASLADFSGMGLFASGNKGPGSLYTFKFVAAGTYPYGTLGPSYPGTVAIPVQASPTTGTTTTAFTITWASATPLSGFVFDVQVDGPTDADFVDLLTDQTATSTTFTPNEGAGGYFFRARLRKTADGTHSNWSPPVAIAVS